MPESGHQVLEVVITPRAAADIVWLQHTLGRRYQGYEVEDEGFCVTLVRSNGKHLWFFGATLEEAVGKARRTVVATMKGGR